MITLSAGVATCTISPADGGRIASLRVGGRELLRARPPGDVHPMMWGSFPMAPWVGRIRRGQFVFGGQQWSMPINLDPHAIHGTTFVQPWRVKATASAEAAIECALEAPWPFGGSVTQHFQLADTELECTMSITAGQAAMPYQIGWHPWFVKPDHTDLHFSRMYARDGDGLPTGALVPPPPGPWDDCFIEPLGPLQLVYSDLVVTISSDCDHWVIYDKPTDTTCVEPQSGPPDGFTLAPMELAPNESATRTMHIGWNRK